MQAFTDRLRSELVDRGLRLVTADLGRLQGAASWVVTCYVPDGRLVRVQVPVAAPPYDEPGKLAKAVFLQAVDVVAQTGCAS